MGEALVALLFLAVMVTVVVKMRDRQPGRGASVLDGTTASFGLSTAQFPFDETPEPSNTGSRKSESQVVPAGTSTRPPSQRTTSPLPPPYRSKTAIHSLRPIEQITFSIFDLWISSP